MDPKTLAYDMSRSYVRDFESELGPHVTNALYGKIRARDLKGLASFRETVQPEALQQVAVSRHLMQVEAFFSKNATFAEPEVTEAAAKASFEKAERLCRITNRRLDHYYVQHGRLDPDLQQWMARAVAYVDTVCGSHEAFLEALPKRIRFTSGATSTRPRREAHPPSKVTKRVVCTPGVEPYIRNLAEWFGYGRIKAKLTAWNRIEVVPKSWKTDRTIACEPEGNLPLQLAVDGYLKDRLRLIANIDLSSQAENQRLAKEASVSGQLATIDLSMASDTLAFNTVAWLYPQPWFEYLTSVRSPCYKGWDGETRPYAKFSSMGNGATFVLETLVFAAACFAVGSERYKVYGDDIVIETELVPDLLRLMQFLGFVVNQAKSYWTGPFRESCGVNCLSGVDITPFYLRGWGKLRPELCHNINGLAAVARPGGHLWKMLLRLTAELHLPRVPFNENSTSGIFIDIHTAYAERLIRHKGWVVRFKSYVPKQGKQAWADSRSLFLWHHDMYRDRPVKPLIKASQFPVSVRWARDAGRLPSDYTERSWVPIVGHKYVRRWVRYIPVAAATPVHLSWWTDDLMAQAKASPMVK